MIERRRDPADRRAWQLHLTARSERVVEQLRHKADLLVEDMLSGLTSVEREEFVRLMKTVGANLTAQREMARASNG